MKGLRITLAAGAAAAMALVSLPAHADEQRGIAFGVRTGYGIPFGAAYSTESLGSFAGGMIPLWFDLGYRFNPNLYLGAFFQYGITFPPVHLCPSGGGAAPQSCNGNDLRGGIDIQYHFTPAQQVDPWVGLGVGYETARLFMESPDGSETSKILHGPQFFDIQLGTDIRASQRVPFGPFLDFSMGRFAEESLKDINGNSTNHGMVSEMHEWLTLGVRGQFNL